MEPASLTDAMPVPLFPTLVKDKVIVPDNPLCDSWSTAIVANLC
jgi:hypothetical protein